MEFYQLNDGLSIPKIGFGTYLLKGAQGVQAITTAIDNGYRLLDTAYNYENEGTLGQAIKRAVPARTELIISSKLPGRYYHYDDAIATIQESLLRSRLDYFDLYLLHWPNPKQDHYVEAWEALIAAQKFGLVRSIGVSNFLPEYIDRLKAETGVTPAVNQIELHPYFNQLQMIKEMQKRKILTMCWSPLGRANQILEEPKLQNLAEKYHKNIGQIILRWDIQNRALPIPKSKSLQRQKENIDVFDFTLSKEEMDSINSLTKVNGRTKNQDPKIYEEF